MRVTDRRLIDHAADAETIRAPSARVRWARLSERQQEIATRLALGDRRHEISAELGITGKTVDSHRREILDRLEVRGTADLTRLAIAAGVITVEVER
jgi:DNA-binding NarL/FixJ family response regulator